jgi:hypothetical protein
MADRELLHAWRLSSTRRTAPHTVRAWRRPLLHLQVWEFSGEASILAVLRPKPFNLLLTFLPVHSDSLGVFTSLEAQVSTRGRDGKLSIPAARSPRLVSYRGVTGTSKVQ